MKKHYEGVKAKFSEKSPSELTRAERLEEMAWILSTCDDERGEIPRRWDRPVDPNYIHIAKNLVESGLVCRFHDLTVAELVPDAIEAPKPAKKTRKPKAKKEGVA